MTDTPETAPRNTEFTAEEIRKLYEDYGRVQFTDQEACTLVDRHWFTLSDIAALVACAQRKGLDPNRARFFFGQRVDLSGNPFDLTINIPAKSPVEEYNS